MQRGNVLVIGNSGVGKSTLINAVLGENTACGTTDELKIYESEKIPFRVIDTIGFEPNFLKERAAINAVKKWSVQSAKEGKEDNQINVIWFCVDGTSRKLFPKAIDSLSRATSMWQTVPLVVVITKSYSIPEREENIEMVQNAFAKQKKYSKNLKKIIPVVASIYKLNETAFAAPDGIAELIDITNALMPDGLQAGARDLEKFKLNRKRQFAHGLVAGSVTAGVVIGAVPVSFADAALLTPLEVAMVNGIARIYGIEKNERSKQFFSSIIEVGTISGAAKATLSMLKNIPGINLGAGLLNAIMAGCILTALGEATIYAFEQVYLGNKTFEDIDWLKKVLESKLSAEFVDKVKGIINEIGDEKDLKKIASIILKSFSERKKEK